MILAAFSSSLPQMTQQDTVDEYLITRQRLGLRRSTFVKTKSTNSFRQQTTTELPTTEWGDYDDDETEEPNTPPYGWGGGWTTTTSLPSTA